MWNGRESTHHRLWYSSNTHTVLSMVMWRIMSEIISIFADGGLMSPNPSKVGGTWAFCCINSNNTRIVEHGGYIASPEGRIITSPTMEHIALVMALESLPDGWSGLVQSDCQVALYRIFRGWRTRYLPMNVKERAEAAVKRLGVLHHKLYAGHPTKADLERGYSIKKGLPVSEHQHWCDQECNRQKQLYFQKLKEDELESHFTKPTRVLSEEEMKGHLLNRVWKEMR